MGNIPVGKGRDSFSSADKPVGSNPTTVLPIAKPPRYIRRKRLKDIPEYEGLYMLTAEGKIYSCRYRKIMKEQKDKDGYSLISLSKDGTCKTYRVHRLVALLFKPNPDNLPEVNHIDCDKSNNHPNNLEWCTRQDNMIHASENSRLGGYSGGHAPRKLSPEIEENLKNHYKNSNLSMQAIGKIYGVSAGTVCKILKR